MKLVHLVKVFAAIWLLHQFGHINAVIMKFTNYVCENMNESIIEVHQCRLKAIKRHVVVLNFNATLLVPVHHIRIEVELFKKDNIYKPWLYKFTVDGCRFLRKAYNPLAIIFYNQFAKFSNFNHTCPYQGSIFIQSFDLRAETFRLPLPTGAFLVDTKWHLNKQLAIISKQYFEFVEDL